MLDGDDVSSAATVKKEQTSVTAVEELPAASIHDLREKFIALAGMFFFCCNCHESSIS